MDNAPIHTPLNVYKLVESREYKCLYLLPYSPFLNPIEKSWSKVKAGVRRNALTADDRLSDRIRDSVQMLLDLTAKHGFALLCHSLQDANLKTSTCEKTERLFKKLFRSSCNAYKEK
jgi:hypothetical protein